MYFPVGHTLGYSHALILYVPFYVAMRLFVHPFPAYSLALAAVMETGIVCLYLLLRRRFHLSIPRISAADRVLLHVSERGQRRSQRLVSAGVGIPDPAHPVPRRDLVLHGESLLEIGGAALTGFLATSLFTHDFYTALFAAFFAALAIPAFARASLFANLVAFWRSLRRPERTALAVAVAASAWTGFVLLSGGFELRLGGVRIASHAWRRPAWLAGLSLVVFLALRRNHWRGAIPAWFDSLAPRICGRRGDWRDGLSLDLLSRHPPESKLS